MGPAGEDRFGEYRGLGISRIDFKLSAQDSDGNLLILENSFREKGGPARHLHYEQEEWFYAVEGEFIIEVGQQRSRLKPGDSLLAPRGFLTSGRLPAADSPDPDRLYPCGQDGGIFREVTKANAMPPQDPELWRMHGMELLGPPLSVD